MQWGGFRRRLGCWSRCVGKFRLMLRYVACPILLGGCEKAAEISTPVVDVIEGEKERDSQFGIVEKRFVVLIRCEFYLKSAVQTRGNGNPHASGVSHEPDCHDAPLFSRRALRRCPVEMLTHQNLASLRLVGMAAPWPTTGLPPSFISLGFH